MRIFLLSFGIMVMVAVAHAATYQWTDNQGGTHFTDDPDKIPAKYRKKVREMNVEPVQEEKRVSPQPAAEPVTPPAAKAKSLYGGHDEGWWRSAFSALRREMKSIEENLPAKRDNLTKLTRRRTLYHKASDRTAYNALNEEIEKDEARIKELQKKLADLDAEAAKAGVPLEWRQ